MKSKVERQSPPFVPVVVTFTLDTQKELDAFSALFNYAPLIEALAKTGLHVGNLYEPLSRSGGDTDIEALQTALRAEMR